VQAVQAVMMQEDHPVPIQYFRQLHPQAAAVVLAIAVDRVQQLAVLVVVDILALVLVVQPIKVVLVVQVLEIRLTQAVVVEVPQQSE
jgi:hypothetical protein